MNGQKNLPISIRKFLIYYFKVNKKRVVSTLIINTILFSIITSTIILSFSLYQNSFYNNVILANNWFNNNEISVDGYKEFNDIELLDTDLLENAIDESSEVLEEIMPNTLNKSVGAIKIGLYKFISYNNYDEVNLFSYDTKSNEIIETNLKSGRLPENASEILYNNIQDSSPYVIGDIINLTGYKKLGEYPSIYNYQIVGIIENLTDYFIKNQLSSDLIFSDSNTFITTDIGYFTDIVKLIKNEGTLVRLFVDIDYALSTKHFITNKFIKALYDLSYKEDISFTYFENAVRYYFCADLLSIIVDFKVDSYHSIYKQFLIGVPLILVISFVVLEITRFGNSKKQKQYRLLKTLGLGIKEITKILLVENILLNSVSLGIGFCSSLVFGYFMVSKIKVTTNITYLTNILNAVSIVLISSLFLIFFLINFTTDILQLKKTKKTIIENSKIKKKRLLGKIFLLPELNFFVPGILFTLIGLLLSFLSNKGEIFDDIFNLLFFIFSSLIALIGILFLFLASIILLRRILVYFWNRYGNYIWEKKKNYLSLTLKHMSIYIENYRRTMLICFILALSLTPGIIIRKSITQHNIIEANLSIGCSDMLIEDWDLSTNKKTNISNIVGVEACTDFSDISMSIEDTSSVEESFYSVHFYVIDNPTEFVEVVNFELLRKDGYSIDDILQLENEYTYMMNRDYARENNYHKNEVFTTAFLSSVIYQQKDLIYVNDFSYFPLKEQNKLTATTIEGIFNQPTPIDLIISNQTKELILENSQRDFKRKDYLLMSTTDDANKTAIKEELITNYGLSAYTLEDALNVFNEELNSSGMKAYVIITILSIILAAIYGGFLAVNSFNERHRLLESIVRSGARSWHIIGMLSLELLLVVIVPILISAAITIPYLNNLISFLLNVPTTFIELQIWFPWWIFILVCLIILFGLFMGWSSIMIPLIANYKPTKLE